jgi:Putative binding domain, N-terminal
MPTMARVAGVVALAALAVRCGVTAPSCTYTVTPTTVAVSPAGGASSVAVSTGKSCSWAAMSNASWIQVLPALPPGRTGSRPAQFMIEPNNGGARSATLIVAGQTVTVTQDAPQRATR